MDVASWTRWTTWKMVVSFVLFCCAGLFLCLHDDYKCSIIVLISKRLLKFYFCKLLKCFIWEVVYIWYQSPATTLGPQEWANMIVAGLHLEEELLRAYLWSNSISDKGSSLRGRPERLCEQAVYRWVKLTNLVKWCLCLHLIHSIVMQRKIAEYI